MKYKPGVTVFNTSVRAQGFPTHSDLICDGLAACGFNPIRGEYSKPTTDTVVCWGWRKGRAFRRAGHNVLVMERAYLGDRFFWTSLAWNGLNGYGDFCLPESVTSDRFNSNYAPLQPWRNGGNFVLIMGQVPGDQSLRGLNISNWMINQARIYERAGFRVALRPHPLAYKHGFRAPRGYELREGPMSEALNGAHCVVTYNSNSGVLAACAGVPVVVADQGGMAYRVASHDAGEDLVRPDRADWAARLAWCQWSPEEIADGTAVRRMFNVAG